MLKKLNPAWLFSIVALAILPCFSIRSTVGRIFNNVGIGLGYIPQISSPLLSISTLVYLLAFICFIILLFKNKYDTNMIITIAAKGFIKILFSISFILWIFNTIRPEINEIAIPNMVICVLFYVVLILFTTISVIPKFEKAKTICKKFFYIPAILNFVNYVLGMGIESCLLYFARPNMGTMFWIIFFEFTSQRGWVFYLAIIIALIDVVATLIFSYKLVNCEYPAKKARVKMDNLKIVNNAEIPNIGLLSDTILKAIKPNLKAPFTAILCDSDELVIFNNENNTYIIEGYVNSQNSFGAMISTDFTVEVKHQNDMWIVQKTKIGVKNAKKYAKNFAVNYIVLSIFVAIMTAIGYFLIKSFIGM